MSGVVGVVVIGVVWVGILMGCWVMSSSLGFSNDWAVVVLGEDVGGLGVDVGGLTFSMAVIVWVVFFVVMGFSVYYMGGVGGVSGFGWLVLGFVLGVEVLLLGSGLFTLFLGWEVLGVVSFLLIGFYCTRSSWGGAMFTLLVNRIGDVGFIYMFVALAGVMWGVEKGDVGVGIIVSVMIVVCLMTKSAQVPVGGWLPLAMAAPTPVSALVHSSTLVIAGLCIGWVYSSYLSSWEGVLLMVGVATLLGASLSASGEADFKKVVAYSTSMHLGLMLVMALIVSWWFMGVHMGLHAFFKSLLFIGVGCAILVVLHDQDFRGFASGGSVEAGLGVVILSSVWSLVGLVYFSGWVTKDGLMEYVSSSSAGWGVWSMIIAGLAGSGVYCIKLISGLSGQSAGKCSVIGEWRVDKSFVWVSVVGVSMLGVSSGIVWGLWGDWGLGALVISGGEKGVYWGMVFMLGMLWWFLGGKVGVGMLVGLEKILGRVFPLEGYWVGLENLWLEMAWLGGVVGAVVESIGKLGGLVASSLVYLDWYVVVMVVLVGLCFSVIG